MLKVRLACAIVLRVWLAGVVAEPIVLWFRFQSMKIFFSAPLDLLGLLPSFKLCKYWWGSSSCCTMPDPMDWMYKKPTIDTEAFLLGKPVDRSLEQLENPEGCPTSNEDIGGKPGALFLEAAASAALEAEAKLREDPLYAIRKREEEQRRMLLNNPVRLKKLQKEMEEQKRHEEKRNKSASEKDLLSKMLKLKNKYGVDVKELLSDSPTSYSRSSRSSKSSRRKSPSPERSGKNSRRNSDNCRHSRSNHERRRSRSRSRSHSPVSKPRRSRSRSPRPKKSRSPPRPTIPKRPVPQRAPRRAVTTAMFDPVELERKRREMEEDAKVRDVQRASNVTTYRQKDKADEERDKKVASGSSGGFIRPMLDASAQSSTLESRIQANRHNIQRTRAALDKDFTKR
ncbi:hypothetical protein RvY_16988 [Ramazzottius varieornatus]|uniref:Uncharacterized protein n=1 Tax=Ramazzottius varieornatus TaxID=947166 RepID=A0A1D1W2Z7_RAMVA|nr:hypothetical protein RvY_16988 [Ramazzottius varieornatus]